MNLNLPCLVFLFCSLLAWIGCGTNPTLSKGSANEKVLAELLLLEPVEEGPEARFRLEENTSLEEVLHALYDIVRDRNVSGVFLRLGPMSGAWSRARTLRTTLLAVRASGKSVDCHFDTLDNVGYAFAAEVCQRISMTAAGDLNLVGAAVQTFFARDFLDRLGVQAELLQVGRYKGGADPFTERSLSGDLRSSLQAVVHDLNGQLVRSLMVGRNLSAAAVNDVLNNGPYTATQALQQRLIDRIAFDDEARAAAKTASHAKHVHRILQASEKELGWTELARQLLESKESQAPDSAYIAVVYAQGNIVDSEEASSGAQSLGAGPFVQEMRRLRNDAQAKAVVVRIDSPGGSALASDRMWQALYQLASKKPVIASIGDMAASGGYYIAAAANRIVAEPTSLVGSIGVFGGKVQFGALAERLGVHTAVLEEHKHASWMSPFRGFSAEERTQLQAHLDATYQRFLTRVATGRKKTIPEILPAAEGRLLTGARGQKLGLVDELGGLGHALGLARKAAHLENNATLYHWPAPPSILEVVATTFGASTPNPHLKVADLASPKERWLHWGLALERLLNQQTPLTLLPLFLEIR